MTVETIGKFVKFEMHGEHVAIVTLDRPEQRNAINPAIANALDEIVARTEPDPNVRAVILASSHEKVFCAGADLAEIAKGNAGGMVTENGGFAGFVHQDRQTPWIAAVSGAAFAGGCEITLACDMIVASHEATLGLPEVQRGLFAGAGGPYRLVRNMPRNIAIELLLTGDPLDAQRAYDCGMFNRLVAKDQLMPTAIKLAEAIANNAPMSIGATLNVAKRAFDLDEKGLRALSEETVPKIFSSEDAQEGPRAFLEKRAPNWKGR
ncbi:MAG: Carnitinyl-CoA dehydratase [Verrucomicrobia subdivision 3 bacterium]|nr:Carnitinyl-CoA dehydratase [Limisphaerales bacterium]